MRKLNVRFLFSLLLGVIVLAGVLFGIHRLQAANIAAGLLWQADQAEKEGKLRQSTRFLDRYLEFAPNDLDQRSRLGKLLANPKLAITPRARDRARFVIDQVLIKDPERAELRKCLVRLALDENNLNAAEEQLKLLEKQLPENGEVALLWAQLDEKKGFEEHAIQFLQRAVKQTPDQPDAYVRLIYLLRKKDRGARGEDFKRAGQYADLALSRTPEDAGVLIAAAELAQDRSEWGTAREYLEKALRLHGRDGRVHQALAQMDIRQGQRGKAIARLRDALPLVPPGDRFELTWTLANLLLDDGAVDEAVKHIPAPKAPGVPDGAGDFLRARVLMAQSRWYDASARLERVRKEFKNAPDLLVQVDLLLGTCYGRLQEPGRQLYAYQQVLNYQKGNVAALQGSAAALMALGQTDQAIELQRQLTKLGQEHNITTGGQLELARALLVRNLQTDKANWPAVEEAIAAAEQAQPGSLDVVLLRAEMHLARKDPAQALAVLQAALKKQPERVELWNALAVFHERQGRPEAAQQVLDDAEKRLGDVVPLRLARARAVAAGKGDAVKAALLRLEEGWQKFPADQQPALLSGLADAYLAADLPRDATRLWQLVAKQPRHAQDVRVRLILFDLGLRLGDDGQMRQALAEIKTLEEGESPYYLYGEAARRIFLARQGQTALLKEARQLLDRVVKLRPAWPAVLLARAEIDEMQGNVEEAIASYRRAVEQGERSPRVLRQLVQLLTQRQRYDEAERILAKLPQSQFSPELQRLKIAGLLGGDKFGQAEQVLRTQVQADSRDYRDQLWMGQVLSANGRPSQEAEEALRRAVALADTVPDTWAGLIQYLVKTNQTPAALKELAKAKAKLPGDEAALMLAQCCELVGDVPQARQYFQAALKHRPDEIAVYRGVVGFYLRTGARQDAEALLRAVLDRKVKAADADLAWARRGLALTLAGSGDPKRLPEAFALVGLSLDEKGALKDAKFSDTESLEDQLARARVLATQNRRPFRVRAIALMEEVNRRQALPPDEQLVLAHLYLANGPDEVSWGKARELMMSLVANYPRNAAYLALVSEALIKNGEAREALKQIGRLEQVEQTRQVVAGASPALELKARALEATGKGREALELLKKYAAAADATPERTLLLAGLCGRLGDLKDAIDLCQQAAAKAPAEEVGGACVALLREARAVPKMDADAWKAAAARAEAWFQEALQKQPQSVALLLQSADLQKLLDRPQDAEKLYRQVLALDPRQVVALNNLAWMLAERGAGSDEALTLINRAIETYGARPEFLDTRAVVNLALGHHQAAVDDLKRAIEDAPTFTKYLHLTDAHHKARNRPAALASLRSARNLMPNLNRLSPADLATLRRLEKELN
jgi:Tfp pilus assembly protein PilF